MPDAIAPAALPEIPVTGATPAPSRDNPPPSAEEPSFEQVLRGLNPLQHVPVVGTIYRAVTGETIAPAQRVAGSLLFGLLVGGPFGALGTALAVVAEGLLELKPDPSCPSFSDPESSTKNQAAQAQALPTPPGSG